MYVYSPTAARSPSPEPTCIAASLSLSPSLPSPRTSRY